MWYDISDTYMNNRAELKIFLSIGVTHVFIRSPVFRKGEIYEVNAVAVFYVY